MNKYAFIALGVFIAVIICIALLWPAYMAATPYPSTTNVQLKTK